MQKMAFVPVEQQEISTPMSKETFTPQQEAVLKTVKLKKRKTIVTNPGDKLSRILKIVLKLANVSGYDENGRIKSRLGSYIDNSNILLLLNYCMTVGKPLIGEQEFITLLKEAKVDPNLIINEKIKHQLQSHNVYNATVPEAHSGVRIENSLLTSNHEGNQDDNIQHNSNIRGHKRRHTSEENDLDGWEVPAKRFEYDDSN